jgi:hypothetical protein
MRNLLLALAVALLASPSFSITVDSVGDTFHVDFNGIVDVNNVPTLLPGLTSSADFTVTGWSYDGGLDQTTVTFDILITNTSDGSIWQSAVVTAIGFDTDPDAVSGSSTGVFGSFVIGGSFPTGAGFAVEYCASNNTNTCNGPGNTPLNVGQSGTATVTMVFSGDVSSLDFTNFGVRYQALDSTQLGISDGSGIGVSTPPIPEPASMAVFGLGALIVGGSLRRRARQ